MIFPDAQTLQTSLVRSRRAITFYFSEGAMSKLFAYALLTAFVAGIAVLCETAKAQQLTFIMPPQPEQIALQSTPATHNQIDEDEQLDPRLQRQIVDYPSREAPGTVIIDAPYTFLYYVLGGGKAIRYGIGVGREGFT